MALRDDLLRGYTAKLAELRWELRAREAGVLRHRDLDATDSGAQRPKYRLKT
jgi:hypothetical protein